MKHILAHQDKCLKAVVVYYGIPSDNIKVLLEWIQEWIQF